MSASARKRANQQAASYWPAVVDALASDDESHVDPHHRVLPCPACGNLLLGSCPHWELREQRRERFNAAAKFVEVRA